MKAAKEKRAEKIAALSMIALNEEESERLEREIPEILALCDLLAEETAETDPFADGRNPAQLRADEPAQDVPPQVLRALSKNERDGYLRVVRTVG